MNALAAEDTADHTLDLQSDARLRAAWRRAREAGPARQRDVAAALGVSEGELIAAHVSAPPQGLSARRLLPRWPSILAALPAVGEVMALTRNASCVHEKTGCYDNVQADNDQAAMGLVLGADIDLRLFYSRWAHGFAVEEQFVDADRAPQISLQFFDAAGIALHKVFARPGTRPGAWRTLVEGFAAQDQTVGMAAQAVAAPSIPKPDVEVDVAAFHQDWAGLRDTHGFFPLLRRHGLARTQALRLAEPRFAQRAELGSVGELLRAAADGGTPIMVFVGNPGAIQIHTGPVKRVQAMGPWLNVLDPGFNLHLREDHVHEAWLVRKPTSDGLVSSLELFDAEGETIAMLFGERKPGRSELCEWRQLLSRLTSEPGWSPEASSRGAC